MHVLVIGGPIASGKSSVAQAVARLFEDRAVSAAVIELDLIYEMLAGARAPKDNPEIWRCSRRLAGALTNAMLDEGVRAVAVEGDLLRDTERTELVDALPPAATILFITLRATLDDARQRVLDDSSRGLSRNEAFLAGHYSELSSVLAHPPQADLVFDTSSMSVADIADAIVQQSGTIS